MFDQGHLGDEVGEIHELRGGVPTCDDDVHHLWAVAQRLQDIVNRDPAVVHCVGELIEDHHVVFALGDDFLTAIPVLPGQVGGLFQVAGAPGEAVSHCHHLYVHLLGGALLAEVGRGVLDELQHDDLHVAAPGPQHHTHCSGGLAFAGARVDNHQPLVDAGAGHRLRSGL